jgi:hypothetical protein
MMNQRLSRRSYLYALAVIILVAFVVPITFLNSSRYSAYAGRLQAVGVLVALILAVVTLDADRHDKQADRVLALHQELVTGEIEGCRIRLIDHLRKRGGGHRVLAVTRDDLQKDPRLSSYDGSGEYTPFHDANTVLRFFERANAAIKARTVHEPLFHELIIRHALWGNAALRPSATPWVGRSALDELNAWARVYEDLHRARLNYLSSWRDNRERDFGHDIKPEIH